MTQDNIDVIINEIKHLTNAVTELKADIREINKDRWTWRGIIIAIGTIISWVMSR